MIIMLFNMPAMLGLAVVAEPLVAMLFGAKWLSSVPFLQVLCLGGVLWPLHVINLNALMAQDAPTCSFASRSSKNVLAYFLSC